MLNTITTVKPWILALGRKRKTIKEPMRLELQRNVEQAWDSPLAPMIVKSESVKLFIDGRLFATAILTPQKRYSRYAFKVVKPKRGRLEVRLTKKLTQLAA